VSVETFDRVVAVSLWLCQRVGCRPQPQLDLLSVHDAVARGALVIIRRDANDQFTLEIRETK
jgi:hypothetical protein